MSECDGESRMLAGNEKKNAAPFPCSFLHLWFPTGINQADREGSDPQGQVVQSTYPTEALRCWLLGSFRLSADPFDCCCLLTHLVSLACVTAQQSERRK